MNFFTAQRKGHKGFADSAEVFRNITIIRIFLQGLVFLYMWYYIGKNISAITLMFLGKFC